MTLAIILLPSVIAALVVRWPLGEAPTFGNRPAVLTFRVISFSHWGIGLFTKEVRTGDTRLSWSWCHFNFPR